MINQKEVVASILSEDKNVQCLIRFTWGAPLARNKELKIAKIKLYNDDQCNICLNSISFFIKNCFFIIGNYSIAYKIKVITF